MWSSPVSDAVVELVAPIPGELVVDLGLTVVEAGTRDLAGRPVRIVQAHRA
jgi:hypothetical protein